MINADSREFINGLYYGDERFFLYNGKKYFVQGYYETHDHLQSKKVMGDVNFAPLKQRKSISLRNLPAFQAVWSFG